jgi:hypothetical protein
MSVYRAALTGVATTVLSVARAARARGVPRSGLNVEIRVTRTSEVSGQEAIATGMGNTPGVLAD